MCEVSERIWQWGFEQAKREIAQRMLALGSLSHEQIAQLVDLPVEAVRELV